MRSLTIEISDVEHSRLCAIVEHRNRSGEWKLAWTTESLAAVMVLQGIAERRNYAVDDGLIEAMDSAAAGPG